MFKFAQLTADNQDILQVVCLGALVVRMHRPLTTRLNTKLEAADLEPMTDLVKDFSSGVKLIEVSFTAQSTRPA